MAMVRSWIRLSLVAHMLASVSMFSLPGIWKLSLSGASVLGAASTLDRLRDDLVRSFYNDSESSVLIKLNPNGSFRQCTEGTQEGRSMSGRWRLRADENKVLFALDRQYYGPPHDILLEGNLSTETETKVDGCVYVGKFMYPKKHPLFFDQPISLSMKNQIGSFSLSQAIATTSLAKEEAKRELMYPISTFYNRSFYLISSPLESRQQPENQPFDVRTMRLQFHSNHTFQAFTPNKILRGRYGLSLESSFSSSSTLGEGELLWFQVSLFGAGRSAPGSVYSEGLGLQKDDQQMYVGEILQQQSSTNDTTLLAVQGSTMIGSDLGSDARPEPIGRFRMVEVASCEPDQ